MTADELLAQHADLEAEAQTFAEEWLVHHIEGREYGKNHCSVLLADNDRERKKIERKLRKGHGIRF